MSSKSQLDDFLNILKDTGSELKTVLVNGKSLELFPLEFKQQKALVTTGLDGLVGVLAFIYQLNTAIIDCTGDTSLKITDRVPLALHLRRLLTDKPVSVDDKEVSIDDLISNISDWNGISEKEIGTDTFTIKLAIPTLTKENKLLLACIEELKPLQDGGLGENIAVMLAYEIPKFITSIEFGEKTIEFDSLNIKEKIKIVNALPASITSQISDFIREISEYDEKLLTVDDVTIELDSSFFE